MYWPSNLWYKLHQRFWIETSSSCKKCKYFNCTKAAIYSNAEITKIWNGVPKKEHFETTLNILGKAISLKFWATSKEHISAFFHLPAKPIFSLQFFNGRSTQLPPKHCSTVSTWLVRWCISCNVSLSLLFSNAKWNSFFHFSFLQYVITILPKFHKPISIKYRLHEKITILNSIANRYFTYATSKLFTDLHEAEREKHRKRPSTSWYPSWIFFKK